MKNFCIIHILLFFLLMIMYQCASAQDFLVTTKGDTLYGETKPITYSLEKKVSLVDKDKKKSTYSMFQIRSFTNKGDTFVPVRTSTGYVFMKVVKPGFLSLLKFQLENRVTYDGLYLLKSDGSGMEVPNLTFRKLVSNFLNECEAVVARIQSGDLGKNNVESIVDEYNACLAEKTQQQMQAVAEKQATDEKISAWDALESKLKAKNDFEGKKDALEMIADIKAKISRNEKVPNFIVEGLKSSLSQAEVNEELSAALKELQN